MGNSFFQITRIASPSTASTANNLHAHGTIAARVSSNGPGFDTHNCYNPMAQVYTIPVDGIYKVEYCIGSSGKSEVVSKKAGDQIQVVLDTFVPGEWLFSIDNRCIGIYDGLNSIEVVESEDEIIVATRLPVDLYRVVKIPTGSKLSSVRVLYE